MRFVSVAPSKQYLDVASSSLLPPPCFLLHHHSIHIFWYRICDHWHNLYSPSSFYTSQHYRPGSTPGRVFKKHIQHRHRQQARSVIYQRKMSQTSATAGREAQSQSSNPRLYQAMGEEIDRLRSELEGANAREARSRLSAQEWQTRAEEAERELSRIQGSLAEFYNARRDIGQAYANVTGQNQDLNPAGHGEREANSRTSGSDQDIVMTGDGATPVSDRPPMQKSRGGSQNGGNPLPYEPNALSRPGSDLHHGTPLQISSLSGRQGLKRPFEPEVGGLEGPSLRRPPPVTTHLRESPPQRPSFVETIGPSNHNAAPSHVAGGGTDLTSRPEHHANRQEESLTGGESPSSTDSGSSDFPTVASLVRANLVASTAPAIPRRHTPVPRIITAPWDLYGPVVRPSTAASFMRTIRGEQA